jgi:hypothetical protein
MDDTPLELFLCETQFLILKPNITYRFNVDKNCQKCKFLERYGGSDEGDFEEDQKLMKKYFGK